MIQTAVDANSDWLANNPIQIELFTVGDFTLSYSGSLSDGFWTAVNDCWNGGTAVGGLNHLATLAGWSTASSALAWGGGCLAGTGAGIIEEIQR